ncbi:AMP-binding enzyme [Microcoleus anatoxicus]
MRVEIEEIETVLMQHPDVQQAAVIGRKDRNGEQTIVAYLVANGQPIDLSQLRSFLQPKLADYMMPSAFEMLDALPLTPNKKLDRHRLPVPSRAQVTVVAARDRLEVELVAIWEKVLGVAPIGINDNFFDLGGHSLLTLSLSNEIEKTLNTKLPVAALFQLTTVEKMASFFQHENRSSAGGSTQEPIIDSATATELFNDSSPEYSGLTTEEYRTLLAIVAGRKGKRPRQNSLMVAISEQGVKPPLFFCASASEESLPLAKNLGQEQPFYFLESGLVVTGNVESKIKAIAAHHVKDILLIQPEPPYLRISITTCSRNSFFHPKCFVAK